MPLLVRIADNPRPVTDSSGRLPPATPTSPTSYGSSSDEYGLLRHLAGTHARTTGHTPSGGRPRSNPGRKARCLSSRPL
ncbi:hypothetical protein ACFQQB_38990 [Nonomuraea rubra]|uniref:hypothetical protein n=1 Tax=Nonomuraea rubra TaxID=46180 RepID=UPI003622AF39